MDHVTSGFWGKIVIFALNTVLKNTVQFPGLVFIRKPSPTDSRCYRVSLFILSSQKISSFEFERDFLGLTLPEAVTFIFGLAQFKIEGPNSLTGTR